MGILTELLKNSLLLIIFFYVSFIKYASNFLYKILRDKLYLKHIIKSFIILENIFKSMISQSKHIFAYAVKYKKM